MPISDTRNRKLERKKRKENIERESEKSKMRAENAASVSRPIRRKRDVNEKTGTRKVRKQQSSCIAKSSKQNKNVDTTIPVLRAPKDTVTTIRFNLGFNVSSAKCGFIMCVRVWMIKAQVLSFAQIVMCSEQ